jgi:hypothetical protein
MRTLCDGDWLHKNPANNQITQTWKQTHLPDVGIAAQKQLFSCRFFLTTNLFGRKVSA